MEILKVELQDEGLKFLWNIRSLDIDQRHALIQVIENLRAELVSINYDDKYSVGLIADINHESVILHLHENLKFHKNNKVLLGQLRDSLQQWIDVLPDHVRH